MKSVLRIARMSICRPNRNVVGSDGRAGSASPAPERCWCWTRVRLAAARMAWSRSLVVAQAGGLLVGPVGPSMRRCGSGSGRASGIRRPWRTTRWRGGAGCVGYRRDRHRVQQAAGPAESRLNSNDDPSRRAAEHLRNHGTRRTPNATVGSTAWPATGRTSRNGSPTPPTGRHEKSRSGRRGSAYGHTRRRRLRGEEIGGQGVHLVGLFDNQQMRCAGDDGQFGIRDAAIEGDGVFQ